MHYLIMMNGKRLVEGITWGKVYEESYKPLMERKEWRVVSLASFYKLRKSYMANYALERSKEGMVLVFVPAPSFIQFSLIFLLLRQLDMCDTCMRLQVIIDSESYTESEKNLAKTALDKHNSAAMTQREQMKKLLNLAVGDEEYGKAVLKHIDFLEGFDEEYEEADIQLHVPCDDSEAWKDVNVKDLRQKFPFITRRYVHLQDYGQNKGLPHFGFKRPGSDYYASCLK
jgi:hypothetical protein